MKSITCILGLWVALLAASNAHAGYEIAWDELKLEVLTRDGRPVPEARVQLNVYSEEYDVVYGWHVIGAAQDTQFTDRDGSLTFSAGERSSYSPFKREIRDSEDVRDPTAFGIDLRQTPISVPGYRLKDYDKPCVLFFYDRVDSLGIQCDFDRSELHRSKFSGLARRGIHCRIKLTSDELERLIESKRARECRI